MAQTMRAAVIYEPGGSEVLKLEKRPVPTPQPGWVRPHWRKGIMTIGTRTTSVLVTNGERPRIPCFMIHDFASWLTT